MITENNKIPFVIGFSAVLIAIIAVNGINAYKSKTFGISYNVTVSKIENAITTMESEGKDYFHSPLYSDIEIKDYSTKPAKFLSEMIGIKKDCGNSNGKCFAAAYKDKNKKEYKPEFKGACAILTNGISICMTPQIKDNDIHGIMDLNGKSSPNILGKDLRTFEISAKKQTYSPDDDVTQSVNVVTQP